MGKVVYSMGVSLDGFIAGPRGEISVTPDEELHRFHNEQARGMGAYVYGRRLYEVMSSWESYAEQNPSGPEHMLEFAGIWKDTPKVEGDIGIGGAGLAASFMDLDLIDEYQPVVHPIVAGGGTPFLPPRGERTELELVESRTFASGAVFLRYKR
jgi:dihydrofolate reductase